MKSIILIGTYLVSFVLFFLLLSLIGVFFTPYSEIITNHNWFMVYTMFLGWWLAIFPAREYYISQEKYFDRVF
jgi:uncharacterized membrane protein